MAIRIYTPELELHLWMGDGASAMADFVRALQQRIEDSGARAAAPPGVNRALVWAFDADGRCLAWFVGEEGAPPELRKEDAEELIRGLEPPPLRAGQVVGAEHYGFKDGDEGLGMTWLPQPPSWRAVIDQQGGEPLPIDEVAKTLLSALPVRRERRIEAPLSGLMGEVFVDESDDGMTRVLRRLSLSEVGAIVTQEDTPSGPAMSLGLAEVPDGRAFILVFADPWEFAHRFGVQFNATVPGGELLGLLDSDPSQPGLLLNSALTENSVIITPSALDLLAGEGEA